MLIIIKFFLCFFYLINFIIINLLWFYFFTYFDNNLLRIYFSKISIFFLTNISKLLLHNKIQFLNEYKLLQNKINIINANHTYQFDLFVFYYIFEKNNVKGNQYSSISTNKNIGIIDKSILNIINACYIDNELKENNLEKSIKIWNNRKVNTYVINFFEGICKCDFRGYSKYKYLLNPKYITLIKLKKNGINTINDINIIYTQNGKILNCKNKDIFYKIIFEDIKIFVEINKYNIPNNNLEKWIDNLYLLKDKKISKNLIYLNK